MQRCGDWYRNHRRVYRVFRPYGNAVAVAFVPVSVFQYMVPLEITSVSVYAGITLFFTLMRLCALASGKWYRRDTTQGRPILETITGPNSIFAVVEENDRQIVFVGVGMPWTKSNLPHP